MGIEIIKTDEKDRVSGNIPPLYVGFEFEFNTGEGSVLDRNVKEFIKTKHNIEKGSHSGGTSNVQTRSVSVGDAKISVSIPSINRYKEAGLVTDFYNDGSVDSEIVTRPILTDKIGMVKDELFQPLRDLGVDFVANGKAGLHMTFLLDPHKELSTYNGLWVQNILQMGRIFYPDIISMRWSKGNNLTRGLGYRNIYGGSTGSSGRPTYIQSLVGDKYNAFHTRYRTDKNGDVVNDEQGRAVVWGIEVRIPDGTNSWEEIQAQVDFYKAFFSVAWETSLTGRMHFSQDMWVEILDWVRDFSAKSPVRESTFQRGGLFEKGRGKNKMLLTKLTNPYLPKEYKPVGHIQTWLDWNNKNGKKDEDE